MTVKVISTKDWRRRTGHRIRNASFTRLPYDGLSFRLTSIRKSRISDKAQFEWDDTKAAVNLTKHGVRFEFAARVFRDEAAVDFDVSRAAEAEQRRKAIGSVDGRLYTVVYTMRQGAIRIISVRRSNAKERRAYATVYS